MKILKTIRQVLKIFQKIDNVDEFNHFNNFWPPTFSNPIIMIEKFRQWSPIFHIIKYWASPSRAATLANLQLCPVTNCSYINVKNPLIIFIIIHNTIFRDLVCFSIIYYDCPHLRQSLGRVDNASKIYDIHEQVQIFTSISMTCESLAISDIHIFY